MDRLASPHHPTKGADELGHTVEHRGVSLIHFVGGPGGGGSLSLVANAAKVRTKRHNVDFLRGGSPRREAELDRKLLQCSVRLPRLRLNYLVGP